jgi:RNA polymerase sigma factor (TIGR02999 family)
MRALAAHYMRQERVDHTLRPTALAHEAYLRLADQQVLSTEDRAHFMALVAQTMRRVLADHARRHRAAKRGGGRQRVELTDDLADPSSPIAADDLDSALEDLARLEPRQARVIELRFYAGFTTEEAATVIGVSPATIKRDWVLARAWLHRELRGEA